MNAGTKKKKAAPKLTLKNLSLTQKLTVEGSDKSLEIDLSDQRIRARVAKVLKRFSNLGNELDEKLKDTDKIEDEIDKLIAVTDAEVGILESFKKEVDDAFGAKITDALFGDCLPGVERYFYLFDAVAPVLKAGVDAEKARYEELNKKYSLERVK